MVIDGACCPVGSIAVTRLNVREPLSGPKSSGGMTGRHRSAANGITGKTLPSSRWRKLQTEDEMERGGEAEAAELAELAERSTRGSYGISLCTLCRESMALINNSVHLQREAELS